MGRYGTAFIAGAVIGGMAGTAVTLWRAPQSGRSTRAQLGEQIMAHAGPARPVVSAAADGLNAAGFRVAQAVNIATRFTGELIHPRTQVVFRTPAPGSAAGAAAVFTASGTTGTTEAAGLDATGTPATVNPGSSFRPAAMNVTSISGGRQPR